MLRGEGWGGVTVWRGSGDADSDEAMKLVPAMSSGKKHIQDLRKSRGLTRLG